jgi:hypothetical protein
MPEVGTRRVGMHSPDVCNGAIAHKFRPRGVRLSDLVGVTGQASIGESLSRFGFPV